MATYTYQSATNSYELTSGSAESGLVIIPDTYIGPQGALPVTSIGLRAFLNNQNITSLVLQSNITNIKYGAFSRCSNLEIVTLGQNIKTLGIEAFASDIGVFERCNSLKEIAIPKSVAYMGTGTLAYCYNLRKVFFSGNYPNIRPAAFYDLTNVTMYRKKNFVTGWPAFVEGQQVVLWSDNVVKSGGTGKLIGKKRYLSTYDLDAAIYINNVEMADGQALEETTKNAINDFVVGCKSDNIWDAIKSSCILAGARTLAGALVPLKGTAPTNVNGSFVSGNYSRSLGLKGNGSTKYLNTNRGDNSDPKDSQHLCIYHTDLTAYDNTFQVFIGSENSVAVGSLITIGGMTFQFASSRSNSGVSFQNAPPLNGFKAISRFSSSQSTVILSASVNTLSNYSSSTPGSQNIFVFAENVNNTVARYSKARIAFYSIGENLDLSLYKARINTLMSTISALT